AARRAGTEAALLQPGVRADVTLLPVARIVHAVPPHKAPAAGTFGGLLGIMTARAGTYRIALGAPAWIDLVGADGKALPPVAHGHGPDCSGIRKIVDFALQPGRYVVQIDGSASATIGVMMVEKA
ncbi:MAG: homogentisate 1,2-dioxygenase, partial [Pseudomonadota bacterium]|nr:homogentisate 1,2-dioxygenase [Pseudomonadota bacterium]